ncbi:pentatricopeptide repeat-containing protein At5g59600-like [Andrographis paniculata]|uniref:pentatricopeptide repeat-containing protein At5g59600-like n=1 Tax=Andrographis paniculata TaxID=175694 RepID=UPI0021E84334|nr:pentatricopeptide repeat-containing protein At5g59600-like [Andrographis paniculata]
MYGRMRRLLFSPGKVFIDSCSLLLQRCMKTKALNPCKQVHALMVTKQVDMDCLSMSSRLIAAYACCRDLNSSKLLLQGTPNPNAFAFNWMIMALVELGFLEEAVRYFSLLQESRSSSAYPNRYTFSVILKACVGLMDLDLGRQVHGLIYKIGLEKVALVCNGLIDMYRLCGEIFCAGKVFDEMPERDIASWTTMICGYADSGNIREAVALFKRMRLAGVEPNEFTWSAIIAGHSRIGDCDGAFTLFSQMDKDGLVPDLVTWNAMLSGFVQNQRGVEALELFRRMLMSGIKPNQVTVTVVLPACNMAGAIVRGREIHGAIYRTGLEINAFVVTALVDMYSKSGRVKDASTVFSSICDKNAASWNAMIGCYGRHGMVDCAFELFERMLSEGLQPNEVTLTSVLYAFSHGGLVQKGLEIFRSMDLFGVEPSKEHYSCLIDLLCRVGKLDEAYDYIKEIGVKATDSIIGAFLNGCKIHERHDLAEKISEHYKMEPKTPGDFVTLSNIYASEGKWGDVRDVREAMKDKKVRKNPGFSSFNSEL